MAILDDHAFAMFEDENIARMEFKDVAIFFTTLDDKPVKIGRLQSQIIDSDAEEAEEEKTAQIHQQQGQKELQEGTHVRLNFEEHPAIDARLSLFLYHVYTPGLSDRQRANDIIPIFQIRPLKNAPFT